MAKKRRKSKKRSGTLKYKVYTILFIAFLSFALYYTCLRSNLNVRSDYVYFYIPHKATVSSVVDSLRSRQLLKSELDFLLMGKLLEYENPQEGLYQFDRGWGNWRIINYLKEGNTKPWINYEIPLLKSRSNIIKSICRQANVDYKNFNEVFEDSIYVVETFNLTPESIYCIFIPGTFKTYRGRTAEELINDIFSEYKTFWNEERISRARSIKCSPEDVVKLASIVYAETKQTQEMPMIAGLYLNRLRKNMLLQADPTVVYVSNKKDSKRVYLKYTEFDSPYNTYKYKGLPPGPIGPAPLEAIEAVLNYMEHNYLYFCAKEDQSGCHYFAEDFEDHKKNARKYRNMLDRKKIR